MPRPRDRYKATAQTYRGADRKSTDTVNAFRRVHRLPELTSISNVDLARPGSDRTYMLTLGQPRGYSLYEMDFANAEMRVLANHDTETPLIDQLARAGAEYMNRLMREEADVVYYRPRLYGSRTRRVVQNYVIQAQNADRVFSGLTEDVRCDFSPELERVDGDMRMPIRSLDEIMSILRGAREDPAAPAKPPEKPPHPDAGKVVERKRKMRRTLLGAEIADYREASGGVARVAQSELDPIKHVNRRKRP